MSDRYLRAAHRIQTAIAFLMGGGGFRAAEPKHLRVGIDTAKAEQGGLASLLIAKGLITHAEYEEAMAEAVEEEADRYEREINASYGADVRTL